ncbi:hypothetical protein BLNAU_4446 [Blattamonas nauphoetae]|uniref:Uncharacterized protein n=1 Tax=Blattamonas nauphoetae TaxID=2049346 RepID=A0ABQ9YA26_9EUKA|nr:hypothetical protein BLNAU_4446 [Blattamonas nauphoetae]
MIGAERSHSMKKSGEFGIVWIVQLEAEHCWLQYLRICDAPEIENQACEISPPNIQLYQTIQCCSLISVLVFRNIVDGVELVRVQPEEKIVIDVFSKAPDSECETVVVDSDYFVWISYWDHA